ncbi:unnamed protein product [Discosporangium mesarthrocarpum]
MMTQAKVKLVAKGYSQKPGVDYFETLYETPAASRIRLLTGVARELYLDIFQFQQAFVQSEIDVETVPLHRALYGLKQASRTWGMHLTNKLAALGLEQCLSDPCVFSVFFGKEILLTLAHHIDEMFLVGHASECSVCGV